MDYIHLPILVPNQEMLNAFKKHKADWSIYETEFLSLMRQRRVEDVVSREVMHESCLLCSEHLPEHYHRRLVAEYLKSKWSMYQLSILCEMKAQVGAVMDFPVSGSR